MHLLLQGYATACLALLQLGMYSSTERPDLALAHEQPWVRYFFLTIHYSGVCTCYLQPALTNQRNPVKSRVELSRNFDSRDFSFLAPVTCRVQS